MKLTGSFYESLDQWVDWQGNDACGWNESMDIYCEGICDIPCLDTNSVEIDGDLRRGDLPCLLNQEV